MKFTAALYDQIARYVAGEMETTRKEVFEAGLLRDNELAEEVEAYREIKTLTESIEQKLCTVDPLPVEQTSSNEKAWQLLRQARQQWEKNQGQAFQQIPDLTSTESPKAPSKVRWMHTSWVAAAMLTGLVCFGGVLWWYQRPDKQDTKVAINPKEPDPKDVARNTRLDKPSNTASTDSTPTLGNTPATKRLPSPIIIERKGHNSERAAREQLVNSYFRPDSLPVQLPDALAGASVYYKEQKHQKAIAEFNMVLSDYKSDSYSAEENPDAASRGEQNEKELARFYARYYLAQSYLAVGGTLAAIPELENAMKENPNFYWKSKVEWYLALAYIKEERLSKAKVLLDEVVHNDPSGAYQQKAIELKRKLKKK